MEIEINGLKYRQKEVNSNPPRKYSKSMTMLLGMAMMFGEQGNVVTSKPQRELPPLNLVEEYKLIQLKKSNLPRKEREMVVPKFEKHYELIKDNEA